MIMKKLFIRGLYLILIGGVGFVAADVINFSNLSTSGTGFNIIGNTLTYDGFIFTSTPGIFGGQLGVWQDNSPNHPVGGSDATSLLEYYAYAQTTITEINNNTFDVNAIDLAPWGADQYGNFDITFVGTKADNAIVQQTFNIVNSDGATPILQHCEFNNFSDLVSLNFYQGETPTLYSGYQFNNISINETAVPEPTILLLVGIGMMSLFFVKFKKVKS